MSCLIPIGSVYANCLLICEICINLHRDIVRQCLVIVLQSHTSSIWNNTLVLGNGFQTFLFKWRWKYLQKIIAFNYGDKSCELALLSNANINRMFQKQTQLLQQGWCFSLLLPAPSTDVLELLQAKCEMQICSEIGLFLQCMSLNVRHLFSCNAEKHSECFIGYGKLGH